MSFGMRLPVTGPLEAMDLAGLDLVLDIHDYLLQDLCHDAEPAAPLREPVAAGEHGCKVGEGFCRWTLEQVSVVRAARDVDLVARLRNTRGTTRSAPPK